MKHKIVEVTWFDAQSSMKALHKIEDIINTDQLVEVFRDGKILKEWKFSEIRERADKRKPNERI